MRSTTERIATSLSLSLPLYLSLSLIIPHTLTFPPPHLAEHIGERQARVVEEDSIAHWSIPGRWGVGKIGAEIDRGLEYESKTMGVKSDERGKK